MDQRKGHPPSRHVLKAAADFKVTALLVEILPGTHGAHPISVPFLGDGEEKPAVLELCAGVPPVGHAVKAVLRAEKPFAAVQHIPVKAIVKGLHPLLPAALFVFAGRNAVLLPEKPAEGMDGGVPQHGGNLGDRQVVVQEFPGLAELQLVIVLLESFIQPLREKVGNIGIRIAEMVADLLELMDVDDVLLHILHDAVKQRLGTGAAFRRRIVYAGGLHVAPVRGAKHFGQQRLQNGLPHNVAAGVFVKNVGEDRIEVEFVRGERVFGLVQHFPQGKKTGIVRVARVKVKAAVEKAQRVLVVRLDVVVIPCADDKHIPLANVIIFSAGEADPLSAGNIGDFIALLYMQTVFEVLVGNQVPHLMEKNRPEMKG